MNHRHEATVEWRAGKGESLSPRGFSRAHRWHFDGGVTVPASSSPQVVPLPMSDAAAVDPEEALVAALASCHMMSFLHLASRKSLDVASYVDTAEGELGRREDGKTAMLVCIYLLLAAGKLPGYAFRNSDSLIALEEISRGARRWKAGDAPGSLTQHTEARDERAAGFLHFRLSRGDDELADFLFPDLPGEWTTALIDHNRSDRLDFLRSADAIWIMLDGVDTRKLKVASLRAQISVVLQEPLLFSGTIAENIRYGRLDASLDDVMQAARDANAHEFIMGLPEQYETPLGERGFRVA